MHSSRSILRFMCLTKTNRYKFDTKSNNKIFLQKSSSFTSVTVMDPFILATGILGLAGSAGLFSTCLDIFNRVDSYKDFGV
jgi:hypothetical protein